MHASDMPSVGWWRAGVEAPAFDAALTDAVRRFREPVHVVREGLRGRVGVSFGGLHAPVETPFPLLASLPPLYPEWLGDRSFHEVHGTRFAYVGGAMANGIATSEMVIALGKAGALGFFGAAGLPRDKVEAALDRISAGLTRGEPWGSNLIHSPSEPELERGVADLYVDRGVRRVSASAYMALTPHIVRYAFHGVREVGGRIERKNFVFAKISRVEVARRFLTPPPADMLDKLVAEGRLTADEARLARRLPVAEDITVEADSGGHTDNQALSALFPAILRLRDEIAREYGYERPIRVGAAGGLGTPGAVASAYAMGAAYVLTGSVNQACVESGLSDAGRQLLAKAGIADVIMAPAADMFELGVKVQVLKRGTMFAQRGLKLHEIYTTYDSFEAIPAQVREDLEKRILGVTLDHVWSETESFWGRREPRELARALRDPKHRMALCFRWYLGLSSRWAISGDPARTLDYQIWCGPAMGSFNAWTAGTFLERPAAREVVQVALNMLEGAATITRAHQLRTYGAPVPPAAFHYAPRPLSVG